MKAQELRIGNLVLLPNGNEYKIERNDFQYISGLSNIEDYQPIPITEKWLIDFGFKAYGSKGFVSKEAFSPGHPSQRFDIDWSEKTGTMCKSRYQEDNDFFTMRHIKYVHQLQNLYFALTGQELQL